MLWSKCKQRMRVVLLTQNMHLRSDQSTYINCLTVFLLCFWALNVVVPLEGQRALGFHQKYLNLCSEDEQRSYGFGTTWEWVINYIIVIFGWTIPLSFCCAQNGAVLEKKTLSLPRFRTDCFHMLCRHVQTNDRTSNGLSSTAKPLVHHVNKKCVWK